MQVVYRTHLGDGQKPRPEWFSKRACLANLLRMFGCGHTFHFIVDGGSGVYCQELYDFAKQFGIAPIVTSINERHNARAFRRMLDYACSLRGMLYLVEDDYLHLPGVVEVLEEGVLRFDYATAYDHPDKYPNGMTRLNYGERCHWRQTPSTTGTFAVQAETLRADRSIWESHCSDVPDWVHDNDAFNELTTGRQCRIVGSSVPAFSTHCESAYLAPLVDWAEVNCQ